MKKKVIRYNNKLFAAKDVMKSKQYEKSIEFLLNITNVKQRDLFFKEKELLSSSLDKRFKNFVKEVDFINDKISKEEEGYLKDNLRVYGKAFVLNFIKKNKEYLDTIENILLNKAKLDLKSKVFYLTCEANIHRYIAECSFLDEDRKKENKLSFSFFKKAIELSKNLPKLTTFRIELYYYLAQYYYRSEKNPEKALQITQEINDELKKISNLDENNAKTLKKFQRITRKVLELKKRIIIYPNIE